MNKKPPFKWLGLGLLLGVLVAVAAGGWLWSRLQAEPEHWTAGRARLAALGPEVDAQAQSVEVRLLPAWSAPVQPGGTGVRTIEARYEEINAWFAVRLRAYLANQGVQWPDTVGAVMIAGRDGKPVLAFDLDAEGLQQIVSLTLGFPGSDVPAAPAGLVVERVEAGVQPMPAATLVKLFKGGVLPADPDPGLVKLLDAIASGTPVQPLVLPIDHLREAELLGVKAGEDTLSVTVRVRRRSPSGSAG